ncbi:uncharacterized protein LOC109848519 isoform X3 [Asparagus officinalis]|nr:uncharacterized protein LOC109848519 isoform X3 [Asparagus officinalis]XP_020273634.1 uncharacterized protein LOC109848519 isoform X3 [Asparagus officinalis]XP_020273637.1 uncharacterized protein LOC109848519 isoform X3 [Asparagus officinalis]
MIDTISAGCTTIFLIGAHTNFAIFLMTNPHLKRNVEEIYVMGGGVRSKNPTGCCPKNASTTCTPEECGDRGNLYTAYYSNPYAEFNIFGDPFAAYQVFHSGIPITLIPLDATNTIPITKQFFKEFERQHGTHEANYCFQSLKIIRDTWFDDQFYTSYFMWDSFMVGVALSIMRNFHNHYGENEFSEMEYMNITVVTSNRPYGINDGSNPFFDKRPIPKFNLKKNGVHSGHVQTGVQDPFCFIKGKKKGRCEDGYTKEVTGQEAVQVLVATKAKANKDDKSKLNREFFKNFLDVLNLRQQSGRFNFSTEFRYYRETLYKPDFKNRNMGKPVIFDMDMSAGDIISLIYLLKVPVEVLDLKGILISGNGWANPATIDIIYDVLHMMGRDDIPVGLGSLTALESPSLGCKFVNAIPHGSGGHIDSDTLFGFARNLPRSPRSYTAQNSVEYGAPRNTDHPELRQQLALEVWKSISRDANASEKITILTNGPLTNLANILLSDKNATSFIQKVYIVGGNIIDDEKLEGNVFTVPSNKFAEFNMFLDPLAAKTVVESNLDITLISLKVQRKVTSFQAILQNLQLSCGTPESIFVHQLLSLLQRLQKKHRQYHHMDVFLGEILGAVFMSDQSHLSPVIKAKKIAVSIGNVSIDGQTTVDERNGKPVIVLDSLDTEAYYSIFAKFLGNKTQSAVVGSFDEQKKKWSTPDKCH